MTEADVPTYQYACTACGHQLEAVQKFSDQPLSECPDCAGRLRKMFSAVGVVFKGSGFYRTDSRAKETSTSAATAAKGESKSESKAESKSESSTGSTGSTKTESSTVSSSTSSSSSSSNAA
jgi:putative FmdB family regulatory protein